MDMTKVAALAKIPQPSETSGGFVEDLQSPLSYCFRAGQGCPAGVTQDCLKDGIDLLPELPPDWADLQTAFASLQRVLQAKGVVQKSGAWPFRMSCDSSLAQEEFRLRVSIEGAELQAADADGMRRGIYWFEDQLCAAEGLSVLAGEWQRRPYVRHRISRCFFGPTYRAPFFIDELSNDIDYYPEEYLNKLAHEGVNGLWLTMYFHDLPSTIFPGRGALAEKRFAKLRQTVQRCARYGIRIYVFFSEPKLFGEASYAVPLKDAEAYPELIGGTHDGWSFFCTSSEVGRKYLEESVGTLFAAVPDLGGMINIMFGEDNGSCVAHQLGKRPLCSCQRCLDRGAAEIFRDEAELMTKAMRKSSPNAEFIGWVYAPGQRDGSLLSNQLAEVAACWPDESGIMFNFESGGYIEQLGKKRVVFDYSLAYIGPSELFRKVAKQVNKPAAKLQVGCSHEDASVPFIPVPGNLYEKYKTMHELGVYAAMQCWYFGNYPGLMNRAAGALSFEPFPENEQDFLEELARPEWRRFAPVVVQAWQYFASGYRKFPANLAFEWYGPLHHSIVWPWHLFPVDQPISPSWIMKYFPEVSGDRIGECLAYHHTLPEALTLCREMSDLWAKGCALLEPLRQEFPGDAARQADINLALAIDLQMKSTRNLLEFYFLREEMLYLKKDHLATMAELVRQEIGYTDAMRQLCLQDGRLGYHSEAEGYLFFPEKLAARKALLEELLEVDFPRFRLQDSWVDQYTGRKPQGKVAVCGKSLVEAVPQEISGRTGASWAAALQGDELHIAVRRLLETAFCLELEPCRMWPPLRMDVDEKGNWSCYDSICREVPAVRYEQHDDEYRVIIPMAFFEGFIRPGFPLRFNLRGKDFSWVDGENYPARLMHRDYNPKRAGWLLLS
ncbi:MAG: hypothetical protein GX927_04265 [Lentisphaerae bacterium]|nr:hypothetical protein [Lentisphaerota bacterium]